MVVGVSVLHLGCLARWELVLGLELQLELDLDLQRQRQGQRQGQGQGQGDQHRFLCFDPTLFR